MTTVALISREDLLPYVNVNDDDDKWDTLLEAMVIAATEILEDYCGTGFNLEESTEYFESYQTDPSDSEPQYLWLVKAPVSEDVAVQVYYDPARVWATALATDKYFVDATRGVVQVYSNSGVPASGVSTPFGGSAYLNAQPGFKVIYEGGYESKHADPWDYLDVPKTIQAACGLQTSYMFRASTQDASGLVNMSGDLGSTQKKLPLGNKDFQVVDEAKALLRRYVRRNLVGRLL